MKSNSFLTSIWLGEGKTVASLYRYGGFALLCCDLVSGCMLVGFGVASRRRLSWALSPLQILKSPKPSLFCSCRAGEVALSTVPVCEGLCLCDFQVSMCFSICPWGRAHVSILECLCETLVDPS